MIPAENSPKINYNALSLFIFFCDMPASATRQGFPILQQLSTIKKFLQDVTFDARYVWSGEICCVNGLKFGSTGQRPPLTRLRSDQRIERDDYN
jgi:hypothetical protein